MPEGWDVIEEILDAGDGNLKIRTTVIYIDNIGTKHQGAFVQVYNPLNNELSINVAFLKNPREFDKALPAMIKTPIPLIADKGTTPTAAFFLLHQMNRLNVPYGSLRHIKLDTVQNFNTVVHLDWLTKHYPTNTADDLIWDTQIVQFVRTPLIQSGHRINRSAIRVVDGINIPATHIKYQVPSPDPIGIVKRYNADLNDRLRINFHIKFEVDSFP